MPPLTAPDAQAPQLPAVRAVSEPAGGLGPQLRCSHTQARGGPPDGFRGTPVQTEVWEGTLTSPWGRCSAAGPEVGLILNILSGSPHRLPRKPTQPRPLLATRGGHQPWPPGFCSTALNALLTLRKSNF